MSNKEKNIGENLIKKTPCGVEPSPLDRGQKVAFTLAEVVITLGIIGVVAAMTLPSMIANIQERVKKEQVRTVKYKLTLATDKMKSLDLIGGIGDGETIPR